MRGIGGRGAWEVGASFERIGLGLNIYLIACSPARLPMAGFRHMYRTKVPENVEVIRTTENRKESRRISCSQFCALAIALVLHSFSLPFLSLSLVSRDGR